MTPGDIICITWVDITECPTADDPEDAPHWFHTYGVYQGLKDFKAKGLCEVVATSVDADSGDPYGLLWIPLGAVRSSSVIHSDGG